MTFQEVSELSRSWGLVFLVVMFGAAVLYAFWPSNRRRFQEASRVPLEKDGDE